MCLTRQLYCEQKGVSKMSQGNIKKWDNQNMNETPEEIAEINRILEERQKLIDSGKAQWLTGEEVKKLIGI